MPAMMRSLSSCFDATRMWRRTDRANLEKKQLDEVEPGACLGVNVNSKRPSAPGADKASDVRAYENNSPVRSSRRTRLSLIAAFNPLLTKIALMDYLGP
jgi:hypothetical protein